MLSLDSFKHPQTRLVIWRALHSLDPGLVQSLAQRIVGREETGSLTPADAEQINACHPDNFARYFGNLSAQHLPKS